MPIEFVKDTLNFKLHYVLFDTPILNVLNRITGVSKGELRRKIKQGAIFVCDTKITDPLELWSSGNAGCFIWIGKEVVGILMPLKNGVRE